MSVLPAHTAYYSGRLIVTGTGRVLTPIPLGFEGKADLEAAGIIAVEQLPLDHELLQPHSEEQPQSEGDATVNLLPIDFPKAEALMQAGYSSLEAAATASQDELTAIRGIGATTAITIQATAQRLLADIEKAE